MIRGSPDDLLDGLVAGEDRAFAALYDRHGAAMFRVAVAILGSPEEAEDAVQDVFISLVRLGTGLRAVRNLKAYLFASVRRAATKRLPTGRPAGLLGADPADPRTGAAPAESAMGARLQRALACLPAEQREIVALHVDAGLTFAACADVLGVSPNTAASRYRYALAKLRDALKE